MRNLFHDFNGSAKGFTYAVNMLKVVYEIANFKQIVLENLDLIPKVI
jgi:hypothetical protein